MEGERESRVIKERKRETELKEVLLRDMKEILETVDGERERERERESKKETKWKDQILKQKSNSS